jgi:hypothetical protein
MESVEYMKDLALMRDLLEEQTNLYVSLYGQFCTASHTEKLIKRIIQVIGTMKDKTKENEKEAVKALEVMNYLYFSITNNERTVSFERSQFMTSITHNVEPHFFTAILYQRKWALGYKKFTHSSFSGFKYKPWHKPEDN